MFVGRTALPAHQQLGQGIFGGVFALLGLSSFLHHLPFAGSAGHLLGQESGGVDPLALRRRLTALTAEQAVLMEQALALPENMERLPAGSAGDLRGGRPRYIFPS